MSACSLVCHPSRRVWDGEQDFGSVPCNAGAESIQSMSSFHVTTKNTLRFVLFVFRLSLGSATTLMNNPQRFQSTPRTPRNQRRHQELSGLVQGDFRAHSPDLVSRSGIDVGNNPLHASSTYPQGVGFVDEADVMGAPSLAV